MSKAWYYNTASSEDTWYIRVYEVDYLGKTSIGGSFSDIRYKKRIIDSVGAFSIEKMIVWGKLTTRSTLVFHKKLDVAKAIMKDMFKPSARKRKWVL